MDVQSLPEDVQSYVNTAVSNGEGGDATEFVADVLRQHEQARHDQAVKELREVMQKAEASGFTEMTVDEAFQLAFDAIESAASEGR